MNPEDWRILARAVNRDIEMLTRASETQGEIRDLLRRRRDALTEEQIIDMHSFGAQPSMHRTVTVGQSKLKVWKVHRLGLDLSDVKGADLYYELGNRKFVLVQYKKPNSSNRVVLDDQQLRDLQNSCPVNCPPTNRFCCGSWYALHRRPDPMYFTACEARGIFGAYESRKSEYFVNGLTHTQFLEEFGSCNIGARTKPARISAYKAVAVDNNRVFVHVRNKNPTHMA